MTANLSNFFLCSEVVAPPVPQWMLDQAYYQRETKRTQAELNNWGDDFTSRSLHKDGQVYKSAFPHGVFLDGDCIAWAQANIISNFNDIRITSTLPGHERCGAHTDRTRNYTLMYLLESGGNDHETVFYKEKGVDELIRPNAYRVDDYECLEIISKVSLKIDTWYLLSARVLHSIENIADGRTSIQISLNEFGDELVLNKFA